MDGASTNDVPAETERCPRCGGRRLQHQHGALRSFPDQQHRRAGDVENQRSRDDQRPRRKTGYDHDRPAVRFTALPRPVRVCSFLALGGLAAWDVAQAMGNRAGRAVMADDWVERKDPGTKNRGGMVEGQPHGRHRPDARIPGQESREQRRHPHRRDLRKDLGNHLAAALELQEVLTKRLPGNVGAGLPSGCPISAPAVSTNRKGDGASATDRKRLQRYGSRQKARARLGIPEPVVATPAEGAGT